jgi:hypothetical protein
MNLLKTSDQGMMQAPHLDHIKRQGTYTETVALTDPSLDQPVHVSQMTGVTNSHSVPGA